MSESMLEQVKRMAQGLSLGDRMTLVDEFGPQLRGRISRRRTQEAAIIARILARKLS